MVVTAASHKDPFLVLPEGIMMEKTNDDPERRREVDEVLRSELEQIAKRRELNGLVEPTGPSGGSASSENAPINQKAGEMDLVGLAFSGGGIRSATFNLGLLQGLA